MYVLVCTSHPSFLHILRRYDNASIILCLTNNKCSTFIWGFDTIQTRSRLSPILEHRYATSMRGNRHPPEHIYIHRYPYSIRRSSRTRLEASRKFFMLSLVNRPHRVHRKSDRLTESRRGEGGKYEWLQIDRFLGRDSLHSTKLIFFYFFFGFCTTVDQFP